MLGVLEDGRPLLNLLEVGLDFSARSKVSLHVDDELLHIHEGLEDVDLLDVVDEVGEVLREVRSA